MASYTLDDQMPRSSNAWQSVWNFRLLGGRVERRGGGSPTFSGISSGIRRERDDGRSCPSSTGGGPSGPGRVPGAELHQREQPLAQVLAANVRPHVSNWLRSSFQYELAPTSVVAAASAACRSHSAQRLSQRTRPTACRGTAARTGPSAPRRSCREYHARCSRDATVPCGPAMSSPGSLYSVAHSFEFGDDPIPMVALDLNTFIPDRATGTKPGFQFRGKLREAALVQRQVGNDRHSLASPAFRLSAHPNDGGLAGNWWVVAASAGGLQLVALGAKELSPTLFCHRRCHFLFLRVFVTIRAVSTFLGK